MSETNSLESESSDDEIIPPSSKKHKYLMNSDSDSSDSSSAGCPICLHSFSTQLLGVPNSGICNHHFCFECIFEWSSNVKTCPIDRSEFQSIFVRDSVNGRNLREEKLEDITKENDKVGNEEVQEEDLFPYDESVFCEICHLGNHEERLLLCDGCDLGYHLECLSPPLSSVPSGRWFCVLCSFNGVGDTDQLEEIPTLPRTIANERIKRRVLRKRKRTRKRKKSSAPSSSGKSPSNSKKIKNKSSRRKHSKKIRRNKKKSSKGQENERKSKKNKEFSVLGEGLALFGHSYDFEPTGDESEDLYLNPTPGPSSVSSESGKTKDTEESNTEFLSSLLQQQFENHKKSQVSFKRHKEIYSSSSIDFHSTSSPIKTLTSRALLLQQECKNKMKSEGKKTLDSFPSSSSFLRSSSSSFLPSSSSSSLPSSSSSSLPSSSSSLPSSSSSSLPSSSLSSSSSSSSSLPSSSLTKPSYNNSQKRDLYERKLKIKQEIGSIIKVFLKPPYEQKKITKESYKIILGKCVDKIYTVTAKKDSSLSKEKVKKLVNNYVVYYESLH